MLIILISIFFILYSFLFFFFIRRFRKPLLHAEHFLSFSVVIACKNEERNIEQLIGSLKRINYPESNYEIIIIDDLSNDNTFNLLNSFTAGNSQFKIISSINKELPAKKGALQKAINIAKYDYILITDADCSPPPNWLSAYNRNFLLGFDFLFGPAPFNESPFHLPLFENLRSTFLTIAAAEMNIPYSAAARNFGFRKEAFYAVNQFNSTLQTLGGDDDLLLREAVKKNFKIGTVTEVLIPSNSPSGLSNYLIQKKRHTKTSHYYLPHQQLFLAAWHLLNIGFLLSPIFALFSPPLVILFFIKLITDIPLVLTIQTNLGYKFKPFSIISLQIQYELLLIYNFIKSFSKKEVWK